jgi:hypothetical protein
MGVIHVSIEGRINVDVLFHDKDGTASFKVVSLNDSREYTTGKVAVIVGTAGTASAVVMSYDDPQPTPYRDASGALVSLASISRVVFSWSGSSTRTFTPDGGSGDFVMRSAGGSVAVTDYGGLMAEPTLSAGQGTGTYTIVLYGT